MNSKSTIANATIAGSFAAALTMIAAPAFAAPKPPEPTMDKCYGIAMKGDNDCAAGAGTTCAGTARADYQGNAWKYVAKGPCATIRTPKATDSLQPIQSCAKMRRTPSRVRRLLRRQNTGREPT